LLGALPLLPFISEFLNPGSMVKPFLVSSLVTGAAFFLVGAVKARFVLQRWFRAGVETLIVGGVASALAYLVGVALRSVVR